MTDAKRRILLAEFAPLKPSLPTFCTWNPADKHADVALSNSNLTATKSTVHATNWACVRGTIPMRVGQWYWETTYNYTGTADLVAGIATPAHQLSWQPGNVQPSAITSIGGPLKNGDCLMDKSLLVNVGAVPSGGVVRHWLDMDAAIYRVANGAGPWTVVHADDAINTIRRFDDWYPIAGFVRPLGETVSMTANFGASPFAYDPPASASHGLYTLPDPTTQAIYLGSEGFNTEATDTPASTHYMGRIAGDQDVEITREGSCFVWGNQVSARGGQVSVVNIDGALDEWLQWEWRDTPYTLLSGYEGDARDDFTTWSKGVVDRIVATPQRRLQILLADPLVLLDRPVQTAVYPDDQANAQARGQPKPITLGRPLYCEGVLLDTNPAARDYDLHDGWLDAIGAVGQYLTEITTIYDRGDAFSGPDDAYTASSPITGANGGDFSSWAGTPNVPAGWTALTEFGASNDRFVNVLNAARCQSGGAMQCAMRHSQTVAVGRYEITFTVINAAGPGTIYFSVGNAIVGVDVVGTGAQSVFLDVYQTGHATTMAIGPRLGQPGSTLDIRIDTLRMDSVHVVDWTYETDSKHAVGFHLANTPAGRIVANPVGPEITVGADTSVAEYPRQLVSWLAQRWWNLRGGSGGVDFDVTTLGAIDAAAHYRMATYLRTPTTMLQLLRQIMDSLCGWASPGLDGLVRFGLVGEPDPALSELTLDESNIVGDIVLSIDAAKGLTQRISGRRNHSVHSDGDLVAGIDPDLKAELTTEWLTTASGAQAVEDSGLPVSAIYAAAANAEAQPTLLQDPADIQALANRVCTIWRQQRMFYDLTALCYRDAADELEPGDVVFLKWPRIEGLEDGIYLRVVSVRSRFFSRRVDLRLWGRAPGSIQ